MNTAKIKVSVPGSLMLFGEHAVLRKKVAIAAAIDQRISIQLISRTDRLIQIFADNFGSCKLDLDNFTIVSKFAFVTTAIKHKLHKIKFGFDLYIHSDFAADLGLGSSAAVTVATLASINYWLTHKRTNPITLCREACKVIREVQGRGSGADVAASVFGGVIAYKMQPLQVTRIADSLPLTVVYSGSKMKTPLVISKVAAAQNKYPELYQAIFNSIGCCTKGAITAIKQANLTNLGALMNIHQELQGALGVSNAHLTELILMLRSHAQIYGAKISGSGLGDCVIGLGKVKPVALKFSESQNKSGVKPVMVKINRDGILYEPHNLSKKA